MSVVEFPHHVFYNASGMFDSIKASAVRSFYSVAASYVDDDAHNEFSFLL